MMQAVPEEKLELDSPEEDEQHELLELENETLLSFWRQIEQDQNAVSVLKTTVYEAYCRIDAMQREIERLSERLRSLEERVR
jgi:predicted RNase H-like nuclease (RuvC/YqgF family)